MGHSLTARARDQRGMLAAVAAILALSGVVTGVVWSVVVDGESRALTAAAMRADGSPATGGPDVVLVTVLAADDAASPGLVSEVLPPVHDALGSTPANVSVWSQSPVLSVAGELPRGAYLLEVDRLDTRAELVDGAWPAATSGEPQVVVPTATADAMGLSIGSQVALYVTPPHEGDGQEPVVTASIVGLVELEAGQQWERDLLRGAGAAEDRSWVPMYGPLLTAPGVVADRTDGAAPARVSVMADPDFSAGVDLPAFAGRINRLEGSLEAALGDSADAVIARSGVVRLADDAAHDLRVTRAVVIALATVVVVLAVSALSLTGSLLVARRSAETALWRTRGASSGQLVGRAALEAVGLSAVAILVAVPLALGAYAAVLHAPVLTRAWPALPPAVPWSWAVVWAVVAGATLPSVALIASATIARRGAPRTAVGAVGRAGLDVAALALAAFAGWQLSERGLAGDNGDVVVLLAPACAIVACGAVTLRVLPVVARAAERLAHRSRGVVVPFAGWGLARAGAMRGAFLYAASAATVVFALTTVSSWNSSSAQQADLLLGADAVVAAPSAPGTGHALAAAACSATAVMDRPISLGSRPSGTRLVALDATSSDVPRGDVGDGASWADALAPLQQEPAVGGWEIHEPAFEVQVRGALDSEDVAFKARLSAVMTDGHGDYVATVGQEVDLDDQANRVRLSVPGAMENGGAWRVVALAITISGTPMSPNVPGSSERIEGSISVEPLSAQWLPTAWTANAPDAMSGTRVGAVEQDGDALDVRFSGPQFGFVWSAAHLTVMAFEAPEDVPVLVAEPLADHLGLDTGDVVSLGLETVPLSGRVVGTIPAVPSRPHDDAILADVGAVSRAFIAQGRTDRLTDAWWASLHCPEAVGAAHQIQGPLSLLADVRSDAQAGPLRAGAWLALWLAAVAAGVAVIAGAAVRAAASVRSRSVVVARLRGLGVSTRTAGAAELLQHASVVILAVALGAATGAVASWWLAPLVVVAPGGLEPVPSAAWVARGWWPVWLAGMIVASVLVAVPWVRALSRRSAASALRAGDDG